MKKAVGVLILSLLLVGSAARLAAHHAFSSDYDENKLVTLKGTVTKIEWTNPHIYTHVEVKEPDGKVVEYRVEGGPPNALYRAGWRKDTLKIGEKVTVSGLRAKIATSTNIGVATVTTADGKRVFATGGGGGAAAAQQQQ